MTESLLVADLLAHIQAADGSSAGPDDWATARLASVLASRLLSHHSADHRLPPDLLAAIRRAQQALLTAATNGLNWRIVRRQALRVLPVVLRVQEALLLLPGTSGSA